MQSYTSRNSQRQSPFLTAPAPEILHACVDHLMRGYRLLRANLPRSEHPTLRQRRLWSALDVIRDAAESIEIEVPRS